MKCRHCSRHIVAAERLKNGCRFRHEATGWRTCTYLGDTFAEPDTADEAEVAA